MLSQGDKITIIVMLILVGVTVNVAMQGGLFNTASDASKKTQAEAYKEELSAAVAGAYDAVTGEINGDKLASNLGTKWSVEGTGPFTCSINGRDFTVSKKGEIGQTTINYEEIFKTATKHPDQRTTNDIGIAEDGSQVNLDLWNYTYLINQNAYMLCEGGETGGSVISSGYSNLDIVDGKIQGKIPMYIKEEGKTNFYAIKDMRDTFSNCTNLTVSPEIPSSVTRMDYTFSGCTGLISAPVIPNGVTSMWETFSGCTSLKAAPVIPANVENMVYTFSGCTNLTGELIINSNPTSYHGCLSGAVTGTGCNLVLKGECPRDTLTAIAMTQSGTSIPSNITIGK